MAEYVTSATFSELDRGTITQAKRCLIDGLACIFAGAATAEGEVLLTRFCSSLTTLFSSENSLELHDRAFLMAALAQVHDANDGYSEADNRGTAFHPGRVLVPAVLALALHHRLSGARMLKALAIGYDLALSAFRAPLQVPSDAFGAAGSAAFSCGLDPVETAFALRVAGFMAPRTGDEDFETNNLTVAQQVASALRAVDLVASGYPISRAQFLRRGSFGFDRPKYLGERLHAVYFKPYPCCRYTHYYIDAALQLRPSVVSRLNEIAEITLKIPSTLAGPDRKVFSGEYFKSYQFSSPYCVAAALVDGEISLRQFERSRTEDPLIQGLQSCMILDTSSVGVEKIPIARIEIKLRDGTVFCAESADALGSPSRPFDDDELIEKLKQYSSTLMLDITSFSQRVAQIDVYSDAREALQLDRAVPVL